MNVDSAVLSTQRKERVYSNSPPERLRSRHARMRSVPMWVRPSSVTIASGAKAATDAAMSSFSVAWRYWKTLIGNAVMCARVDLAPGAGSRMTS